MIAAQHRCTSSIEQPALKRAIRLFSGQTPDSAKRAAAALNILLEDVRCSAWHEVAWVFSRLTGDGFPVEFSFSTAEESLRYTTEIAGPELDDARRLPLAEQLLTRLTTGQLRPGLGVLLREIQQSRPLRYGTWVGGRHGPDGDHYKLYVEVPDDSAAAANLAQELLGGGSLVPNTAAHLQMLGCELSLESTELYYRVDDLEPWAIGVLLRRVGLESRKDELLGLIEQAHERSIERVLPCSRVGFSYSIHPDRTQLIFSLFFFAGSLFGGDRDIRRRILSLAERKNWNLQHYAALSEPLADRGGWMTDHTMITFVVSSGRPAFLHIGLRPPEVDP